MENPVYIINGKQKMEGEIFVGGSKNSALPILIASTLCKGETTIKNCPFLSDTENVLKILKSIGCSVKKYNTSNGSRIVIDSRSINTSVITRDLMGEIRASILFLAPLARLFSRCTLSRPGGCKIGSRPIDIHINALQILGIKIKEENQTIIAAVEEKIRGGFINLSFPSVGATENIILAAVTADGDTTICNPAREPEIEDLVCFLNKCGGRISFCHDGSIFVEGVRELTGTTHTIIPDRITAATFMGCVSSAGGSICLRGAEKKHLHTIIPHFRNAGCDIKTFGNDIVVSRERPLKGLGFIKTHPYPGFPTDAQAIVMSNMTVAIGTTTFYETIFENRYNHVPQLCKMGADIIVSDRIAHVNGVKSLHGANVESFDLRGGVALVVAALGAEGETQISGTEYIERGYDALEKSLSACGCNIKKQYD